MSSTHLYSQIPAERRAFKEQIGSQNVRVVFRLQYQIERVCLTVLLPEPQNFWKRDF